MLADLKAQPNVTEVFDSSKIPGEIMDMMVVNTKTLHDNPALGKALTGAWFEMVALMHANSADSTAALDRDGQSIGHRSRGLQGPAVDHRAVLHAESRARFRHQPRPAEDHDARRASSRSITACSDRTHQSADVVGMAFDKGVVIGNKSNVKLRFDPTYVEMAAAGKL